MVIMAKNPIVKFLTIFFAFAFACGTLQSCKTKPSQDVQNETQGEAAEAKSEPEGALDAQSDDLPELDYGGDIFKMLTFTNLDTAHLELLVEEQNGEIVNDSIYLSNRLVQD
ncbi:MAG: hypothetical protein FWH48_08700, partial [Oscillospiraceae bacterium]|nr:hypothetical protein [Oscillospiraceae bacterium]